jgi:hypothetical protein
MGPIVHPARLGWDSRSGDGRFDVWATATRRATMGSMRGNVLDNAYRSAEAAGYPALLIVSMISLGWVVVPVTLLG